MVNGRLHSTICPTASSLIRDIFALGFVDGEEAGRFSAASH